MDEVKFPVDLFPEFLDLGVDGHHLKVVAGLYNLTLVVILASILPKRITGVFLLFLLVEVESAL